MKKEVNKIKKILIVLVCLLLSGCWTTPPPPEPNETVYRAFLVGVEDCYIDEMDLPVAGYNVERLREIFSACKFTNSEIEFSSIDILRGSDSTKEAILEGILFNFEKANKDDISYFYFMGHGGVRDGQPILCPTDYTGCICSAITLEELETTFDMIHGTKILFLESCHSGNFIEKDFNNKVVEVFSQSDLAFNKDNYQVITSSSGSQYSWYQGVMSFFTMGLYQGCKDLKADTNKDKIVDFSELYEYIVNWIEQHNTHNQDAQMYPDGSIFPIVEF